MALALLAASCTSRCNRTGPAAAAAASDGGESDAGTEASATSFPLGLEHAYQPIHEGDTWVYQTTQTAPAAPKIVSTSTERILSVERGIDRVVARVTDTQTGGGGNSGRSLILTPLGISPDIGVMRFSGGTVTTLSTTGVFLPMDPAVAHKKWSFTQVLSSAETSADLEVTRVEGVVVPAGEYQAVHVKSIRTNGKHVQHDDSWYARGVGLVKSVTATATGYRSEKVLVSFARGP